MADAVVQLGSVLPELAPGWPLALGRSVMAGAVSFRREGSTGWGPCRAGPPPLAGIYGAQVIRREPFSSRRWSGSIVLMDTVAVNGTDPGRHSFDGVRRKAPGNVYFHDEAAGLPRQTCHPLLLPAFRGPAPSALIEDRHDSQR